MNKCYKQEEAITVNKNYPYYVIPSIKSIKDMLEQRAVDHKGKTAFTFRKGKNQLQTKIFDEVYSEVRKLEYFLTERYPVGSHIAVIGENSYEWILAFLAIVTSGNVAVPIDKELPANEVATLISKADVTAVFCSGTYIDLVDGFPKKDVYMLKSIYSILVQYEENGANNQFQKDDLACIFFTSGTSGNAKGVMLSQGNLVAEINNTCQLFKLEGDTLAVLPFHHAFGLVVGVLMVYNYGYCNFINKSLKRIKDDLLTAKPQTLFLVPLFVETFYKQIWDTAKKTGKGKILRIMVKVCSVLRYIGIDIRSIAFKSIRQNFGGNISYIICGGAMLDPFYVKEFRSFGIEVLNGYGTTECSPCTAVNRNNYHKDGSVGVLIPESEVKIADDGEVWIKGPHVMLGYYKDQQASAAVLMDGWYATGDLGVLDENGFLTLTGRKKNLIIVSNGENISPEELENDIGRDPSVIEVLVYDKAGLIIAEIYPDELHMGDEEYFEKLRRRVNTGRPIYKQIAQIKLRDKEFIKNTSKKIVRYKNIEE